MEQSEGYDHEYATWIGSDGDELSDPSKWDLGSVPTPTWSAVVNNTSGSDSVVSAAGVDVLGLEVRGNNGMQTVRATGTSVTGRNEVRIREGGRIHLDQGTLASWRWTDIHPGGLLSGFGTVVDDLHNLGGTIAPGLPSDLPVPAPPPVVTPGVATAVDFDIQGQDPASVTTTDTISPYVQIAEGLHMGPGLSPRGAADEGNEFNVTGFNSPGTGLGVAVSSNDYLAFTLDPVPGVEMLVDTITFVLRRNGSGSAQEYAILSSLDGFGGFDAIDTASYPTETTTETFTATYTGGAWTSGPVEIRLYGWKQSGGSGAAGWDPADMACFHRFMTPRQAETSQLLLYWVFAL